MAGTYNLEEGSIQHGFAMSRAKMQIFAGGYGNGKTTAKVIKALRLCRDYPGSNGLIARSTYPKLNDTIRKVFLEWCPPHWIKRRPTQDDNTCYLVNGTVVNFRYIAQRGKHTDGGETTSNLLSATYDWIVVDQIEDPEIGHKDFLDLLGRLRGQTAYRPEQGEDDETMPSSGPRWIMLGANPTRNWFYKEIIQPYQIWRDRGIFTDKLLIDEKTRLPIMEIYEGSTYTNARNLPPDFIQTMTATYRGSMKRRFIDGEWAAYEGLVHPDFDRMTHMITRDEALAHLHDCKQRHVDIIALEGYDFGLSNPSCYLLGFVDDWGRIIILDGYYEPDFSYEDQPARIREIRAKYAGYLRFTDARIIADPAIFKRIVVNKRETGDTVAKLLVKGNESWLKLIPGNNAIEPGIAKVNAYLAKRKSTPYVTSDDLNAPMIYFVDDLNFIEDEFSTYLWRKNTQGNQLDEPVDDNDHAMNTLKYMLSKRPDPSAIRIPSQLLPPQWKFWHEERV